MTEEILEYLGRENAKKGKMIARFRCGNEERENRYLVKEEKRRCRMCYTLLFKLQQILYKDRSANNFNSTINITF
jgi:hypothetical protein